MATLRAHTDKLDIFRPTKKHQVARKRKQLYIEKLCLPFILCFKLSIYGVSLL